MGGTGVSDACWKPKVPRHHARRAVCIVMRRTQPYGCGHSPRWPCSWRPAWPGPAAPHPASPGHGGSYAAVFTAPPGTLVMLRTSAPDAAGGTVTETITSAYRTGR